MGEQHPKCLKHVSAATTAEPALRCPDKRDHTTTKDARTGATDSVLSARRLSDGASPASHPRPTPSVYNTAPHLRAPLNCLAVRASFHCRPLTLSHTPLWSRSAGNKA
ncbi:hypothetical protein RRF57_004807 [Xylaria bambusicola]|uniref:Uncharacterized protein n=1 Tax=Xylaria bambusicola TaxID=326684 RepID=A0AAN7Z4N3_9PEZI